MLILISLLFSLDRSTPIPRHPDDEDSFPVLCDRELHSLHRNVPALRRRDVDTATIKQHYYPEGKSKKKIPPKKKKRGRESTSFRNYPK